MINKSTTFSAGLLSLQEASKNHFQRCVFDQLHVPYSAWLLSDSFMKAGKIQQLNRLNVLQAPTDQKVNNIKKISVQWIMQ